MVAVVEAVMAAVVEAVVVVVAVAAVGSSEPFLAGCPKKR